MISVAEVRSVECSIRCQARSSREVMSMLLQVYLLLVWVGTFVLCYGKQSTMCLSKLEWSAHRLRRQKDTREQCSYVLQAGVAEVAVPCV